MITEIEEHSVGTAKVQFTVSRRSLPNLLEWSQRLQARFGVTVGIQWELEPQAAQLRDTPQVRWVMLTGPPEACRKAKKYITIFCDANHRMDITYPKHIHSELKESQARLEEEYSTVMQFFKVGQLLLKSNEELNLSLVVSVIDGMASKTPGSGQSAWLPKCLEPGDSSASSSSEPDLIRFPDEELTMDYSLAAGGRPEGRGRPSTGGGSSALSRGARDLLGGETMLLRSRGERIVPGQVIDLLSPPHASHQGTSVSPDRKKIRPEEAGSGSGGSGGNHQWAPTSLAGEPAATKARDLGLLMLELSSQQQRAVDRILGRGEYTRQEVEQFLRAVGSHWLCSDLIVRLHDQRTLRSAPQAPAGPQAPAQPGPGGLKLDELKSTQQTLMRSLLGSRAVDLPPDASGVGIEKWPPRISRAHDHLLLDTLLEKDQAPQSAEDVETRMDTSVAFKPHLDMVAGTVDEAYSRDDSVIIIPSDNESVIVLDDSADEATSEVFYGTASRLPKKPSAPWPPASRSNSSSKQTVELRGIIEGLQQQVAQLQERMERERAEASSQQEVVNLLQQTQQEEIGRQYRLQQQQLEEQQQQLQSQFEQQEKVLKEQQELALKELQQQQQQQQKEHPTATPDSPNQGIVIAPARKNNDSLLRPIVIDGSNVAMKHGRGKVFSCRGIALCIQYFQRRGHQDITVFVPQGRSTQNPHQPGRPVSEQRILDMLERQGLLSYTPSRRIGNTYVTCYDDRFVVELAVKNGGAIVSNDNYRDLMGESLEWKHVIENRLVMYTFAGDHFMIPDDPMGRQGPHIDQILRRAKGSRERGVSAAGRQGANAWPAATVAGRELSQHGLLPTPAAKPAATMPATTTPAATTVQARAKPRVKAKPTLAAALGPDPAQKGPAQMDSTKRGPTRWGPAQKDPAQKDPAQKDPAQKGPAQKNPAQKDPAQKNPAQRDPAQKDPAQRGLAQKDPAQRDPAQRGPAQRGLAQRGLAQKDPAQRDPAQRDPGQRGLAQRNPAQRDPAQHPSYHTLLGVFPDSLDAIGRVLARRWETEDANELVLAILEELASSSSSSPVKK